jgi:hypothetical protein
MSLFNSNEEYKIKKLTTSLAEKASKVDLGTLPNFRSFDGDLITKITNEFTDRLVNVKWFGASGSSQTTGGTMSPSSNQITLNSIIDFQVGQGIAIRTDTGVAQVTSLQITAGATASNNLTVTIGGCPCLVAVLAGDTSIQVADKIRAISVPRFIIGGTSGTDTITFTAKNNGVNPTPTITPGSTGVTGTMTVTTAGTRDSIFVSKITAINGNVATLRDNAPTTISNMMVKHDDTEAINSTISSVGYLGEIFFPKGTYRITSMVDFVARKVRGSGIQQTILTQENSDQTVCRTGSVQCYLGNMTIQHTNRNTTLGETVPNGVGVKVYQIGYGSTIERLEILNNTSAFYCNIDEYASNWTFSATIKDLVIGQFSHSGMYLRGSSTGNVISNIYMVNWDDGVTRTKLYSIWGFYTQTNAQNVIHQLNVEHGYYTTGIEIVDSPGYVITSIHFEGLDLKGGTGTCSLIKTSFDSDVIIHGLSYTYSLLNSINTVNMCLFQTTDSSTIDAKSIDIHDITIVGGITRRKVLAGGTLQSTCNINIDKLRQDTNIFPSPDSIDVSYTGNVPLVSTTQRGTTNRGTLTYNGDGSSTSKTIAHGLGAIPSYYHIERASLDAGNAGIKYVTADATNLTVYYITAPISGTNNVVLKWKAEL